MTAADWAAALPGRARPEPEAADGLRLLADQIRAAVATRLSSAEQHPSGLPVGEPQRQALVEELIAEEIAARADRDLAEHGTVLDGAQERFLTTLVEDALLGLGPLQRLLADPQVENVNANGCDAVWIRYADGRKEPGPPLADSDEALIDLLRTLAARSGAEERRFDRGVPRLNIALPDGSRLFAVMAVSERVSVSIRRHRYPKVTLDQLRELGVFTAPVRDLLAALVRARKNLFVAGGTNVGKTTLLRGLASQIPAAERLVTIEDTFELGLGRDGVHTDVTALQAREPNIEGQGAVDQAELVRWGLRMAPDRVIVGEVRGAEVVPMCNAMSQGNDGSLSTIHASTSRGVFTKLAAYAAQSPERLSLEATNLLVASAVHIVLHLSWDRRGRRVLDSVREIVGADGPQIVSNEVLRPGPDGALVAGAPLREQTAEDLAAVGFDARTLLDPNSEGRWAA